jgi:hypothetical protein
MNRKYITYIVCGACVLLGSCRPATPEKNPTSKESAPAEAKQPKRNIVRQHIAIPSTFTHITNLGSIDIIYTQGDFNIDVEGDSAMLGYLNTTFESNLLTTNIYTDNNPDINLYGSKSNIKMYVSCPDLQCVSICGNGGFTSKGTWETENAQIGVFGSGTLKLGDVQCTTFKLESGDKGPIRIQHLKAEDASIYSHSPANIDADLDVNRLSIFNVGTGRLHFTGRVRLSQIQHPDDPHLKLDLRNEE